MKFIILITLIGCALAAPKWNSLAKEPATFCDDTCVLPDCRCSGTDIPGDLNPQDIPQLVFLTFDDAVTVENYQNYYQPSFYGRTNPDGCPIGTTYFVSHEYTDYTKVHDLYSHGQEIALHSISHTPLMDYWKSLPVEDQIKEFGGERDLVSTFANIPEEDIKGMRLPLLQLSGDNTFEAMEQTGLEWDCSWPTRQYIEPGFWPYSLDYESSQDCTLGSCPTSSFPGKWVVPMIMWEDDEGVPCSMVDACVNIPDDAQGIFEFAKRNFLRQYNGNRAPFGFYVHAAWFLQKENAFEAYTLFLDYLQTLSDVYLVSVSRGLEWVRNPQPLGSLDKVWSSCQKTQENNCKSLSCALDKEGETRYMVSCAKNCPAVYPWLEHPLGNK